MKQLPDHILLEAYKRAIELDLDPDFIRLLEFEIEYRGLKKT